MEILKLNRWKIIFLGWVEAVNYVNTIYMEVNRYLKGI